MYRADMIGIEIDGLPRSMYGDGPAVGGVQAMGAPPNEGPSSSKPSGASRRQELKETFKNSKEYTVLKKVIRLLQDNRLNSGDEETEAKLEQINSNQSESYPILKTILNVLFITTGLVLLIGVVIVIIYTSIVKPDEPPNRSQHFALFPTPTAQEPSTKPAETISIDIDSPIIFPDDPLTGVDFDPVIGESIDPDSRPIPNTTARIDRKGSASQEASNKQRESTTNTQVEAPSNRQLLTVETVRLPNGKEVKTVRRCRMHAVAQPDTSIKFGRICYRIPISQLKEEEEPEEDPAHEEELVTDTPSHGGPRSKRKHKSDQTYKIT